METDPMTSYAMYRPDLSEARLLSIAHRKAVELNASQQTAHSDPPQANGVIDPELPASPPPPRPRRSSYASYAQPVSPPPTAADGDGGPAGSPLPYAGSSISVDGSPGGVLPRRPSTGGHLQQASSASSGATRMDGFGTGTQHSDAQQGGANGLGGAWPAVSAPLPGYTRAGTALGKAGFQVSRPVLSPIVSPTESPRTSLDQTETPQQQEQQRPRLQNGTRLTTAIRAVSVSSDGGPAGSAPVDDLLTQYSSLYSSPRAPNPSAPVHGSDSLPAAAHASATPAEVAAVAAAFGDYDAEEGSRARASPDAHQPGAPVSPFVPTRSGSGSSGAPARSGSGSSASPESPKLTNRRLESVIKPPRHSKRRSMGSMPSVRSTSAGSSPAPRAPSPLGQGVGNSLRTASGGTVRSVSSVSVESCVSDIVAELPPSFTVPLEQLSVEELENLERERSAQRMELYIEHERFQTEQRQRHLARQSRKDRHRSLGGSSGGGSSPAGSFSLSERRRSSLLAADVLGDHGGATSSTSLIGSTADAQAAAAADEMQQRAEVLKRELYVWRARLDTSVVRCSGAVAATRIILEQEASRFRRDVAAARAEAEFHVKASAAIVASAIDAAPKIPALLDAIEEELAEEESKLSWTAAPAAPTANGSGDGALNPAVPGTPQQQQHQTAAAPSAAPQDAAFMSPEPGQKRVPPPTPARTPARRLHSEWK